MDLTERLRWVGVEVPPFEVDVPCGGETHVVRWDGSRLAARDHPEEDDVLHALGGPAPFCQEVLVAPDRQPMQLMNIEELDAMGRQGSALYLAAAARTYKEPSISNLRAVPRAIRRMAMVGCYAGASPTATPETARISLAKRVARRVVGPGRWRSIKLVEGDEPAVLPRARGERHIGVAIPRSWLGAVYVLALEDRLGQLVLDARCEAGMLHLDVLSGDSPSRLHTAAVSAPAGTVLPAGTRHL